MGSGAEEEAEEISKSTIQKKATKTVQRRTHTKQESPTPDISSSVRTVESSPSLEGTVAVTEYTVAADLQDLDEKIKSMIGFSENKIGRGAKPNQNAKVCKVCGKEGQMGDIQRHIEANHITGLSHTCNNCSSAFKTRNSLQHHNSRFHVKNTIESQ